VYTDIEDEDLALLDIVDRIDDVDLTSVLELFQANEKQVVGRLLQDGASETLWLFGERDSSGAISHLDFMKLTTVGSPTLSMVDYAFVMDETGQRVRWLFQLVDGLPSAQLLGFDYSSDESVDVSVVEYDWATGKALVVGGFQVEAELGGSGGGERQSYLDAVLANLSIVVAVTAVVGVGLVCSWCALAGVAVAAVLGQQASAVELSESQTIVLADEIEVVIPPELTFPLPSIRKSELYVVQVSEDYPANLEFELSARCLEAGDILISGGCQATQELGNAWLYSAIGDTDDEGRQATLSCVGDSWGGGTVTATAVCSSSWWSKALVYEVNAAESIAASGDIDVRAACELPNDVLVLGGCLSSDSLGNGFLYHSLELGDPPQPSSVRCLGRAWGETEVTARASCLRLRLPGLYHLSETAQLLSGSGSEACVKCLAPSDVMLGTGCLSSDLGNSYLYASVADSDTSELSSRASCVVGSTAGSGFVTATATCVSGEP
jgi:hypothetical protein